jgi:hypothetical protein
LHQGQVEDGWLNVMGCVELYYPCFVIFYVLDPRGMQSFSLVLEPLNRILKRWGSLPLLLDFISIS